MLISVQTLQPKFSCTEVQHWIAVASRCVRVHPLGEHHAHLRHLQQFFRWHAGRGRVAGDFGQLGFHGGGVRVELAGFAEDFGKVNGRDADAVAFENFFGITDRVERARPRADRTQPHAVQAVHHATDAEEILQIM